MGINNKQYNSSGINDTPTLNEPQQKSSALVNYGKIFGYMASALLLTAGVALLFGFLFSLWIKNNGNKVPGGLIVIQMIASVLTLIAMILMNFVGLKKKAFVTGGFYLFAGLMGVTLSTLTMYVQWWILGAAFAITSVVFLLMWGIAAIGKEKLKPLAIVGLTMLFGAFIVGFITFIILLFAPISNPALLWIIDFVVFAAIMFITMADMARIQTIASSGGDFDNLAVYCACTLYIDFIYNISYDLN